MAVKTSGDTRTIAAVGQTNLRTSPGRSRAADTGALWSLPSCATDCTIPLKEIWSGLGCGRFMVLGFADSDTHHTLLLRVHQRDETRPPVNFDVFERALNGGRQSVPSNLERSMSSVAYRLDLCLGSVGLTRLSQTPLILVIAFYAAKTNSTAAARVEHADSTLLRVSLPRSDAALSHLLPPSESVVVRMLITGASYAEIAQHRGTSIRTVANQVSAAFRRLKVSGRMELLALLARQALSGPADAHPLPKPDFEAFREHLRALKESLNQTRPFALRYGADQSLELTELSLAVLEKQFAALEAATTAGASQ